MARYESGRSIEVVSGTAVDVLEEAKVISESMWVVRHATTCKNPACEVAGCAAAKAVFRVLEEQDKGINKELSRDLFAACDFVRSVLDHVSSCPWASANCGERRRPEEPCLLCALVSRARPQRDSQGRLRRHLDFSKRSLRGDDAPNFSLPQPAAAVDAASEMRRSNTTEELAMLLSDLSRHKTSSPDKKRRRSYEEELQQPAYQNESTEDEDAADQSSLPPPSSRSRNKNDAPLVKIAHIHSRNHQQQYQHHRHPALPPPKKQFPLAALRVATHSQGASLGQRSPSFSAAASSLLALTGGIVGSNAKSTPGQSTVVKQHQRTLLVPQC